MPFRAILISKTDTGQKVEFVSLTEADLMEGDVTVDVTHSSVNYKDGLALTAKSPIVRRFPLIPGIDFAGTVRQSSNPRWKPGDRVVLNGWGVGEQHHGGFSEVARVPGDWLVPVPEGWTCADTMAVGVAGYTAMLCVMALEEQGVKPGDGDILVTGAAGGVGTTAIVILAKLGYRVVASTGRVSEAAFLKELGAAAVVDRNEFNTPVKPLAKARWAGAIDSVGSVTLANVLSQTNPEGTVVACGLAQGMDLPATVAPFILRGIRLIGVNSVTTPMPRRLACWQRIRRDLDLAKLKILTSHVTLDEVPRIGAEIVAGKVRGRVVVDIR
ncbi:MAG: oxidoreductase [Rhizobiales bacterium]|nr:oxidoreductase [Hyphomicrobiales bacterium]MBI3674660.1 oxidoreductase [Hyphomicrobiales bacterium]